MIGKDVYHFIELFTHHHLIQHKQYIHSFHCFHHSSMKRIYLLVGAKKIVSKTLTSFTKAFFLSVETNPFHKN